MLAAFVLAGCSGSDDAAPNDDAAPDIVSTDGAATDPTEERTPTTTTSTVPLTTIGPVATSAAEPELGAASPEAWTSDEEPCLQEGFDQLARERPELNAIEPEDVDRLSPTDHDTLVDGLAGVIVCVCRPGGFEDADHGRVGEQHRHAPRRGDVHRTGDGRR